MKACEFQSLRLKILSLEANQSSFSDVIDAIDKRALYRFEREFPNIIFLEIEEDGEDKILIIKE